ncbi:DUF3310 domain-containing protein [Streptomyces sp. NPDC058471]|uniref:DUF3310 domain-containing protein n=1 Tax=Streptomyces sp. NPDC058471 TaxID=3346516 RepID=UPI003655D5F2
MTQRMLAAPGGCGDDAFVEGDEHDWTTMCDEFPRCDPVNPDHVERDELSSGPPPKSYDPPPSHYATGGIDPWAYIEAQQLDYWQGNIVKYITRAGRKDIADKLDDLKKVRNFINRYIEIEEKSRG